MSPRPDAPPNGEKFRILLTLVCTKDTMLHLTSNEMRNANFKGACLLLFWLANFYFFIFLFEVKVCAGKQDARRTEVSRVILTRENPWDDSLSFSNCKYILQYLLLIWSLHGKLLRFYRCISSPVKRSRPKTSLRFLMILGESRNSPFQLAGVIKQTVRRNLEAHLYLYVQYIYSIWNAFSLHTSTSHQFSTDRCRDKS